MVEIEMHSFKRAVSSAIASFNRYRSPEVRARLVNIKGRVIAVDFKGLFAGRAEHKTIWRTSPMKVADMFAPDVVISDIEDLGDGFRARFEVKTRQQLGVIPRTSGLAKPWPMFQHHNGVRLPFLNHALESLPQ